MRAVRRRAPELKDAENRRAAYQAEHDPGWRERQAEMRARRRYNKTRQESLSFPERKDAP